MEKRGATIFGGRKFSEIKNKLRSDTLKGTTKTRKGD